MADWRWKSNFHQHNEAKAGCSSVAPLPLCDAAPRCSGRAGRLLAGAAKTQSNSGGIKLSLSEKSRFLSFRLD